MNHYRYSARGPDGRRIEGEVSAFGPDEATKQLQDAGVYVISVVSIPARKRPGPAGPVAIQPQDRIFLLQAWAMFLESGISVQSSLLQLRMRAQNMDIGCGIDRIRQAIDDGSPLGEALKLSRLFPASWIAIMEVAEKHGDFVQPLRMLQHLAEEQVRFKKEMVSMVIMPCILLALIGIWLWLFLDRIVPNMVYLMEAAGTPGLTSPILLLRPGAEAILTGIRWGLLALVAGVLVARLTNRADKETGLLQSWIPPWMPVAGSLIAQFQLILLTSGLRMQLEAGIPLLSALETMSRGVTNWAVRLNLIEASKMLRGGDPVSTALSRIQVIPEMARELLVAGNESGKLPQILDIVEKEARQNLFQYLNRLVILTQIFVTLITGILTGILVVIFFGTLFGSISNLGQMPDRSPEKLFGSSESLR